MAPRPRSCCPASHSRCSGDKATHPDGGPRIMARRRLLEEVADLVAGAARAKGVGLVASCNPEVPLPLRGDLGRLRRILHNFATTPSSSPRPAM